MRSHCFNLQPITKLPGRQDEEGDQGKEQEPSSNDDGNIYVNSIERIGKTTEGVLSQCYNWESLPEEIVSPSS